MGVRTNTEQKNIDNTMRILTGIAIILVVLGHLDYDVLSIGGLFPYYSFHVMIFLIVSGYFYKPEKEKAVLKYVGRKALHLLVPYYIWNVIYGILSTILAGRGFEFCNKITVMNLLVEPFLGGHQYGFNFAAWFVPALFVIEVINIFWRKLMSLIHLNKEVVYFAVSLILGIVCVYLAQTGHVWGYYKTPGRILFMLPVYELGRFYRVYLEEKERNLSNALFFPVVIAIQLILLLVSDGALNFSAVWCTGFASLPFVPYLTIITGTAFWLRISRLISKAGGCRLLEIIGQESFSVMMHHVFAFFVLNVLTMAICNLVNPAYAFDKQLFMSDINYVYLVGGIYSWKLVYVCVAIALSIAISRLSQCIQSLIQRG